MSGINANRLKDDRISSSGVTSNDQSGATAWSRRVNCSWNSAVVPGWTLTRILRSGAVPEPVPVDRVRPLAVELAVLAVRGDDADDALLAVVGLLGPVLGIQYLAEGRTVVEELPAHVLVDHDRLIAQAVVFASEPPPFDDLEPEHVLEAVGRPPRRRSPPFVRANRSGCSTSPSGTAPASCRPT